MQLIEKKFHIIIPLILGFIFLLSNLGNNSINAQMPTPTPTPTPVGQQYLPQIKIHEAYGYKNISTNISEDYFVLVRYDLSVGNSPDTEWCRDLYLKNPAGCDTTPPNPTFPFSLYDGLISAIYYDNAGVLHTVQPKVPRIGKGLLGIYSDPPAATSFGFNLSKLPGMVCLVFSTDYFVPYPNSTNYNCVNVVNEANGRVSLSNEISSDSGILYRLETDLGLPLNTLVSSKGKVTPSGQVYLEEALQGIVTVAKNAQGESVFQLGVTKPNEGFEPTGASIPLQDIISATATASEVSSNLDIVSGQYLGFDSGAWFGLILFLFVGLLCGGLIMFATKSSIMAILTTVLTMLPAVWIGSISIAFLFSFLSLFILLGSWYWIRKEPG